jgi:hypothetical protein
MALKSDGSIVSWGDDSYGQVSNTPTGTGFERVSCGHGFSLVVRTNGSIAAWGEDFHLQVTNAPSGPGHWQAEAGADYAVGLIGPPVGIAYCTPGTSASACLAAISASGVPSATKPHGFRLYAGTVEGGKDGMFFYGANGQQAVPWGTGFQCVAPPVKRAGLLAGVGTASACDGFLAQDLNALWCPTCPKPPHNPGPGATIQAQFWYRDPWNTATTKGTTMSDAIEFVVEP